MKEEIKKKNILDLQFQKYLIIASTTVIIAFTYFIGIVIAILTKQIDLQNFVDMAFLFVLSVGVLGICSIFFFSAVFHIKNIPEIVKEL